MKKAVITMIVAGLSLFAGSFHMSIPVEKTTEIISYAKERVPVETCYDEKVIAKDNSDIGAVLGGIAGGILGHQIGGGSGKDVATVGGAIIGTITGKNLSKNDSKEYRVIKRCKRSYETRNREIIKYKNYATIGGRTIVKISNRPLNYIRVKVSY
jgi:uncharacterized protein YcfJ